VALDTIYPKTFTRHEDYLLGFAILFTGLQASAGL